MKVSLFALFVFFFTFGATGFSQEVSVRVPVGNTYPPFFYLGEEGRWHGLSIELAEILLAEAGLKPVYKPLPFPRALAYLREGELDMMLNLTITEERNAFLYFIGPQLDEIVVLVVKKETDLEISSLDDFKKLPKPVGIERGKIYGNNFEEKRKQDPGFADCLDEVTEINLNETKLEKDRISAFLGYGYNTYYRIKTDPLYQNFKVHAFIVNEDWVYFGFSKKSLSEEMFASLRTAYESATRKGLFEKVRRQYILE